MTTTKKIICLLMSLLLSLLIFVTVVFFNASKIFDENKTDLILKESKIGEKLMGYSHQESNEKEIDIYKALAEKIPNQPALAVNISGEHSNLCQKGAFEYAKEKQDEKYGHTSLDNFVSDLATGYVNTAISNGYINPNQYMTYKNVHNERVYVQKGTLLMDTMLIKYRDIINNLIQDDFFCALDIDQKNTLLYILSTGKDAIDTKDNLYRLVEEKIDGIFVSHIKSFINRLLDADKPYEIIEEASLKDVMKEVLDNYLKSIDIPDEYLDKERYDSTLEKSVHDYIYPRLFDSLPSYESTVSSLPSIVLKEIGLLKNNTLFFIGVTLCVLLILLLLKIGKIKSLLFIGIGAVVSGGMMFSLKYFAANIINIILSSIEGLQTSLNLIIPGFASYLFENISRMGLYILPIGLLMIVVSLLFRKKNA